MGWFGAKNLLAGILRFPPVNAVVVGLGRQFLKADVLHRIPVPRRNVAYALNNGKTVSLGQADRDLIAKDLFWGKSKPTSPAEAIKLEHLERLCSNCSTFIDIGAYTGICALIAARSSDHVRAIAYEIVPENFLLLSQNIANNDLLDRVEARLCGLGAKAGSIRVPARLNLPSLATSVSLGSAFEEGVSVPVRTLDDETEALIPPFVVKIDVEGFEPEVLGGGQDFLSKHKPDIICEVLPDAGTAKKLEKLLKPLGYHFHEFTDSGLRARASIKEGVEMRDWLFTVRDDYRAKTPKA